MQDTQLTFNAIHHQYNEILLNKNAAVWTDINQNNGVVLPDSGVHFRDFHVKMSPSFVGFLGLCCSFLGVYIWQPTDPETKPDVNLKANERSRLFTERECLVWAHTCVVAQHSVAGSHLYKDGWASLATLKDIINPPKIKRCLTYLLVSVSIDIWAVFYEHP